MQNYEMRRSNEEKKHNKTWGSLGMMCSEALLKKDEKLFWEILMKTNS